MDANGQNLGGAERADLGELREKVLHLSRRVDSQAESIKLLCNSVKGLDRQRDVLLRAVRRMAEAMRIQEKRETEEFHISAEAFRPMWAGAVEFGEHCLREIEGGAT